MNPIRPKRPRGARPVSTPQASPPTLSRPTTSTTARVSTPRPRPTPAIATTRGGTGGDRRDRPALTRGAIVDTALALIDRDGLVALSMRRLGTALGVEAMALYHHFAGKGELLDAVMERLLDQVPIEDTGADPVERLRDIVSSYRRIAVRHPKAFVLLTSRRFNTPVAFAFYERLLQLLADAGFDAQASARLFRLLGYFVSGAGLAEIASRAQQPDATPVALERPIDLAQFPRVAAVAPHLRVEKLDEIFGYGLDVIFEHLRAAARDAKAAPRTPETGTRARPARR